MAIKLSQSRRPRRGSPRSSIQWPPRLSDAGVTAQSESAFAMRDVQVHQRAQSTTTKPLQPANGAERIIPLLAIKRTTSTAHTHTPPPPLTANNELPQATFAIPRRHPQTPSPSPPPHFLINTRAIPTQYSYNTTPIPL
ncbi:hypothetical protein KC19_1G243900 [Ceratodon purpureus]|uniref:Uncharacterized protein n=1 Tax=Ceratodon purpureus TaxID=3225 RepID=A0A8T0JBG9_CERPU|nr:hypothetical protein KC19_1G243900 [Ceratodon purpureus]